MRMCFSKEDLALAGVEKTDDGNLATDIGKAAAAGVGLGAVGTAVGAMATEAEKVKLGDRLAKIAEKTKLRNYLKEELGQDLLEGIMSAGSSGYAEYAANMREIARHRLKDQKLINIAQGKEWMNRFLDGGRFMFSNNEDIQDDIEEMSSPDEDGVRLPGAAAGVLAAGIGAGIAVPATVQLNKTLLADYKNRLSRIIQEASKDNYVARQFIPGLELHHNNVIHRLAELPGKVR